MFTDVYNLSWIEKISRQILDLVLETASDRDKIGKHTL